MALSLFGYIAIGLMSAILVTTVFALVTATKSNSLFLYDFGTILFAPSIVLVFALARREMHFGYGVIIWPALAFLICCALFSMKSLLADRSLGLPERNSIWCFYAAVLGSLALGMFMGPWYE